MSSESFDVDASIRPATAPSNDPVAYASPYTASSAWIDEDQQREEGEGPGLPVEPQLIVNFLGWFSIGVGLAQLVAPRLVGRAIGVGEQHTALIRSLGVREVTSGLGLLSGRAPSVWAWSRVGGDALDLALLGAAARTRGANPQRIAAAATAVLGVTALDVYASRQLGQIELEAPDEIIRESLAINSTPQALYTFWKNVENLPRFMGHLESVTATGERTSHWIARAPARMSVEWDAEIVRDDPDEGLSWQTVPGSEVTHEGTVRFEPARSGRGTIVRVEMRYKPPAGKVGVQIARLFGEEPQLQIRDDLRRLKQLIETGELATTFGQPSGRRSLIGRTTLGGRVQ